MKIATPVLRALTALVLLIAGLTLDPARPVSAAAATCEEDLITQLADLATFRVRTTVKRADGTLAPPRTTGALPLGLAAVPTDRGGLLHVTLTPPVLPPDGTILPATATVTKLLPLGALPVRVEILVDLPCGATVTVGYDGTESRAPSIWSASVAFSAGTVTTGDVALTTVAPGPNLTTIAALNVPGVSDTSASLRLAPVPPRFAMTFTADEPAHRTGVDLSSSVQTTATATVDDTRPGRTVHADATVAALPGTDAAPVAIDVVADPAGHVDVHYAAPQRIARVDINATVDDAGDKVTVDGLVEDVPDAFIAVADLPDGEAPTVTWNASARLGHLDATVDVTPADAARSQARLDVVGLPPHLVLTGIATAGALTGAEVTLDEPVERVEGGFAKGQDVVLGTDRPDIEPYVRHDADITTGSTSVAARLVGVTHARVDTADPIAVEVTMTPGDLRVLVIRPGELDLRGTVTGFPSRMAFDFSPRTRTLHNRSTGPIGVIDVVAEATQPLFGEVHHAALRIVALPPELDLTIGVAEPAAPTALVNDDPPITCNPLDPPTCEDPGGGDGGGGGGGGGGGDGGGGDGGGTQPPADPEPVPLITFDAHGQQVGELSVSLASSASAAGSVNTVGEDGFFLVDSAAAFVIEAKLHGLRTAEVRTANVLGPNGTLKAVEVELDAPLTANDDGFRPNARLAVEVRDDRTRTRIQMDDRPDVITSLRVDRNVVFLLDPVEGIVETPLAQRLHYEATSAAGRTTLTSQPVRTDDIISGEGLSVVADSVPTALDFCFAQDRRCTGRAEAALRSLAFTASAPVHVSFTSCAALRCQPCVDVPCDPGTEVGEFVHADVTAQVVRAQVMPEVEDQATNADIPGHLFLDTDNLPLTGTFNLHDPDADSLRDLVLHLPAGEPDGDPPSFSANDYLIVFAIVPISESDGAVRVVDESGSITCPAGTTADVRVRIKVIAAFVISKSIRDELCLGIDE